MKYYIIAGEASGDLHGSNLILEILKKDPHANIRAWGGDKMQNAGATISKHIKELAFMGFVEVVMNLRTILKNIKFCKQDILDFNPDMVILIDYPGFNMRLLPFLKEHQIKNVYYISPQIWAWKQKRVFKIKELVDRMIVILPFEKEFYQKFDYQVDYVGHPLLDEVVKYEARNNKEVFISQNNLNSKPIIALLPGSRKQEIKKKLPIMLSIVNEFPNYQFIIAGAPSQEEDFYSQFVTEFNNVNIIFGKTYQLLQNSEAALVTSGTATLETALFEVPQVVCYKGNAISYRIAKRLIKVKYISLVNLIMDKEVVTELIQKELNEVNVKSELLKIISNGSKRETILTDYKKLKSKLGNSGASEKAASIIVNQLI